MQLLMHILTFNDSLAKPQVKLSMHSYLYPTEIINVFIIHAKIFDHTRDLWLIVANMHLPKQ